MSQSRSLAPKDPDAVKDYQVDWSDWLAADTISDSDWIVPAGITKDSDSFTTTTTTIWLSGGTDQATYALTNRITTAGGRSDDRTIKVPVEEM